MRREERAKCAYRVLVAKYETEAVDLVFIDGIVIEDLDVHLPFSEVVCFDDLYPRRELLFGLGRKSVVIPNSRRLVEVFEAMVGHWAEVECIPSVVPAHVSILARPFELRRPTLPSLFVANILLSRQQHYSRMDRWGRL